MQAVATNIGAAGRRRRYAAGIAALVLGLAAAIGLLTWSVDVGWRAWLVVPFWVAGLGLFQATAGT